MVVGCSRDDLTELIVQYEQRPFVYAQRSWKDRPHDSAVCGWDQYLFLIPPPAESAEELGIKVFRDTLTACPTYWDFRSLDSYRNRLANEPGTPASADPCSDLVFLG
ncbi:hypothetical protein [Streptomyces sp. NPDC057460]|uniref:hypothetical protein n=1 Tax=Streptomyces sp. NPDC057460 TaxID=3346141 RepID=UPI003682C0FF